VLNHLQGIIFDLDGTLVDSQLDFAGMRRETGCPSGRGLLEHLETLVDDKARHDAEAVIHRYEMQGARAATWMPGADSLLQRLSASDLPLGIVTRNSRPATQLTLTTLAAPPLDLITREDAAPKPNPEGLLNLADRWGILPEALAYVGDFRFDLEAARRARMTSVLYLQEGNRDYADLADVVFSAFDELAALLPLP
jgi:HAD superfamily hydrolase (TIGR01509 family)